MDNHSQPKQTLSEILNEAGKLDALAAKHLIGQLLDRLHDLHRANLIHRNVCSDEIYIDHDGNAFLSEPVADDIVCSIDVPEFAALPELSLPQQIDLATQRIKDVGVECDPRRFDIFAAGRLAVEALTAATLDDYLTNPNIKNEVGENFQDLIDQALGFDPNQRAVSANELVERLNSGSPNANTIAPTVTLAAETNVGDFQMSESTLQNQTNLFTGSAPTRFDNEPETSKRGTVPFEKLGQYKLVRQLGQGGMGAVFLASDVRLERSVALKVLTPDLASNPDFVERFKNEARSAAKLDHPHIVPIYNIDEDQGYHFFVMQYVEGKSLAEIMGKEKKLPEESALQIIEQIASGLIEAHSQGLVHRDIKPANIMVQSKDGKAMLADFGLVKSTQSMLGATATGVIMGTVNYISPEQGRGQTVDGRSDLYSLGVTLYHVLTGQLPFRADNAAAMIFQHVYERPTPIGGIAPELSAETIAIVERLLQKEPDQRYQNAQDLANDIKAVYSGQSLAGLSKMPNGLGAQSAFNVGQLDDWMKDWDDSTAELAIGPIDPDDEDRLLALVDVDAPEPLKRLQNAYQQVQGGLAVYTTRRNELAKTIIESEKAEQQTEAEIVEVEKQIAQASQQVSDLPAGPEKDAAQQEAEKHQASAEELNEIRAKQNSDTVDVRQKMEHIDKTIEDLQQQQRMLMARLKKAEAQIDTKTQAKTKSSSVPLPLVIALTLGALALVTCGGLAWRLFYPPSESKPGSDFVSGTEFPAAIPFETKGGENPGPRIYAEAGLIDYRHLIDLASDTTGENWQRQGRDILLTTPSAADRLAFPMLTSEGYDLDIEYTTDGAAFDVAIPVGIKGLALLRLGFNNGNGIELLGLTGVKSWRDRNPISDPFLKLNPNGVNKIWVMVNFTDNGVAALSVFVNKVEVLYRERVEEHFQFDEPIAQHTLGSVPMIIGSTGKDILFNKLAVRFKGTHTNVIRQLQPPARMENTDEMRGLKFSSSEDEIVSVRDYHYSGEHPLTIEAWVIPEEKTNSHVVCMCPLGNVGLFSIKVNANEKWVFTLYDHLQRISHSVPSKKPVDWNQRVHIAGIYDDGQIEFFVNGVSQGLSEPFDDVKPKGTLMRIGSNCYSGGKNHFFKGTIDELRISKVRVYNEDFVPAENLSADENSMAMYDFDEEVGKIAFDNSGNDLIAVQRVDIRTKPESDAPKKSEE